MVTSQCNGSELMLHHHAFQKSLLLMMSHGHSKHSNGRLQNEKRGLECTIRVRATSRRR